jgi:hypothetical protein
LGNFSGMTAWDRRIAQSTLGVTVLAFVVGILLTAATDEGGVAWRERAVRTLPLLPACAALGTFLTLRAARRKGELRVLETLGCSEWRCAAPAVLAGALGTAVGVVVAVRFLHADVAPYFPRVHADGVLVEPTRFLDAVRGIAIAQDGTLAHASSTAPEAPVDLPSGARGAVALVTLLAGLALPALVARLARRDALAATVGVIVLGSGCILLFHASAVGWISPYAAAIPMVLLLAAVALRYRQPSWNAS